MRSPAVIDRVLDATLLGYTRLGPALRHGRWKPIREGALEGRVVVVTGATSGIGRAAVTRMGALGAHVVIVGRSETRAAQVAEDVAARGGTAAVEIADLSLMSEVRALAGRLLDALPSIHVLVNNVGVLLPQRRITSEGLEATFATNLLGHYLLTSRLIPRLEASAPARILNVSSGGMYTQGIRLDDLQMERDYDGRKAYARTKRGQVILTEMWAEQLADSGVVVHAMHPGWVETPGVASGIPLFSKLMGPVLRDPDHGADTIVWLAASGDAAETTGRFWHDRVARATHRTRRTVQGSGDRTRFRKMLEELSGRSPE